jgi:hypothetical protein
MTTKMPCGVKTRLSGLEIRAGRSSHRCPYNPWLGAPVPGVQRPNEPGSGEPGYITGSSASRMVGCYATFHSPRYSRVSHFGSPPVTKVFFAGSHLKLAPYQ